MIIHAYIIAWNEEKLLPFTLDHYSQFCKKIYVYDNMSTDGSDEIYKKYDKVVVKKWQTKEKKYNDTVLAQLKSKIYKQSRKKHVDWVIVCDADEYLYHKNLFNKLKKYKQKGITMPSIDGRNMFSLSFPEYDGRLLTDKIKTGSKRLQHMCKNIIFAPSVNIKYFPGAHENIATNAVRSKRSELKLLHYKFLGEEYIISRSKELATQLSPNNNNYSKHWIYPSCLLAKLRVLQEKPIEVI